VVTLATIGVAYSAWTDALTINGTVTTGELDVIWTDWDCYDSEALATISSSPNPEASNGVQTIDVSISNGYPGYTGYCWFDSLVRGTLPVKIKAISFTAGANLACPPTIYDPSTGSFTATCDQLEIRWTDGLCKQFAVGSGEGSNMRVKVLPGAAESTGYQFTIAYTYEQAAGGSCP
jgi:hypothetical protein